MALPTEFIERLKEANPILDVISSYVNVKKTSSEYVCVCPFHNDKNPSLHIHPDQDYFFCFGCHLGGDVITFVKEYENLTFWDAVKLLAERGNVPLPENDKYSSARSKAIKRTHEMNRAAARFFYSQLKSPEGHVCIDYLVNKRGLSFETIKKYGMGYAPNSWSALKKHMLSLGFTEKELIDGSLISHSQNNSRNTFDFFVNRAMFPFIDLSGNIVGFGGRTLSADDNRKYLNSKETVCYSKNRFLFSMNFAKNAAVKSKTVILCEGNLDVISLNQAGFENAIASCGTAITPQQAKIISQYANEVDICYDSDDAGQKATSRAIDIFTKLDVQTKTIHMKGAKDPDEYVRKYGSDHFKNLLENSIDGIDFELNKCKEGLNMSIDLDKQKYLKMAYKVIAQVTSETLQAMKFERLSKETGVRSDLIRLEFETIMDREKKYNEKKEWEKTANFTNRPIDTVNPEANKHQREAKAESGIIYYLMKNPDKCENINSRLSPDKFVTSLNRKLYESLVSKILNSEDFSITAFNDEFSIEEVSKLAEILEIYSKLAVDENVVDDYVNVLLNYREKPKYSNNSTDDEFLKDFKFNQKRIKIV